MPEKFPPPGFTSSFVECDGTRLHFLHNGDASSGFPLRDKRSAVVFLHGFPEFWIAWQSVFVGLADDFLVIAPDQRGYNLSDAPEGVENYQAKRLVNDISILTDTVLGSQSFALAGHDWGGSIAYALAMRLPERISHLVIANGVHPVCFQEALIDDPDQAAASNYFHILRREDASRIMAANDFEKTFSMFEKFSQSDWLDEPLRQTYRAAWSQPGRLKAMLHWYNSSPIHVPDGKEEPSPNTLPLYGASRQDFRIAMPHLLIWGERDQALLPSANRSLEQFCDHLERINLPDADHWLLHTHGDRISDQIRTFICSTPR